MTLTSGDPDRLAVFLDQASRLRGELGIAEMQTRSAYAMFLNSGSLTGGGLGGLPAVRTLMETMEANERFLTIVRDALVDADRTYRSGPVTVVDSVISQQLEVAGLTDAPMPILVMDTSLFGEPVNSGFVDDPVCTATGNFVHIEVDLAFPARSSLLDLSRTYNSLASKRSSAFGPGWSSIFDVALFVSDNSVRARLLDGAEIEFVSVDSVLTAPTRPQLLLRQPPDSWELRDGADSWIFDASGQLLARRRGQVTVELTRDAGRITSLSCNGRSISVTWIGDQVTALSANDGREVHYHYSDDGHLLGSTRPTGGLSYAITDDRITKITDADGALVVTNVYDEWGRVVAQTSPFGRVSVYTYGPTAITVATDTEGAARNAFFHDERGNLTGMVDARGYVLRMTYDDRGHMTAWTDRRGGCWQMAFERDLPVRKVDPMGRETTWVWDDQGRLLTEATPAGTTAYSSVESFITPRVITDPAGAVTMFEIGPDDLPVAMTDPDGVRVELTWTTDGQLASVTMADGTMLRLSYDALGNLVRRQDPSGVATDFAYDLAGCLVRSGVSTSSAATTTTWSPAGRALSGSSPSEGPWTATYSSTGVLETLTDAVDRTVGVTHDVFGNLQSVTGPDGRTWQQDHDGLSQVISATDAAGSTWHYDYDPEGALTSVTDPDGGVRQREVDAAGRTTVEIDGEGRTSHRHYDQAGWLTKVVDPGGNATHFAYDACGRPVYRWDETGLFESFSYSPAGRLTSHVTSAGLREQFTYDNCGRAATLTDADGALGFVYDHGQLVAVHDEDGDACVLRRDEQGRLIEIADRHGRIRSVAFDDANRPAATTTGSTTATLSWTATTNQLASATDGNGAVTTFAHDLAGRIESIVDPTGAVTRFGRDDAGRLTKITSPLGVVRTISRSLDGDVTGVRVGDLAIERDVDYSGRTKTIGGVPIARDKAGSPIGAPSPGARRITQEPSASLPPAAPLPTDSAGRVTGSPDGQIFRHDAAGQLIEWVPTNGPSVRYDYDAGGRLIAEYCGDDVVGYSYNAAGQLLRRVSPTAETTYRYDNFGRRISEQSSDDSTVTYEWDAAGRLSRIAHQSATAVSRVSEIDYDNLSLISRVSGTTVSWDLTGAFPRAISVGNSSASVLTTDWMGNAEAVLDPWGASTNSGVRLGYRSELCIDHLVWLHNRVYDPTTRSFLSPDPLPMVPGRPCAGNPYHYAWNDPVTFVDPSGLRPLTQDEFQSRMSKEERNAFSKAWDSTTDAAWDATNYGIQQIRDVGIIFHPGALSGAVDTVTKGFSNAAGWTIDAGSSAGHWIAGAASAAGHGIAVGAHGLWTGTKWTVGALGTVGMFPVHVLFGAGKGLWHIAQGLGELAVISYELTLQAVVNWDEFTHDWATAASTAKFIVTHPLDVAAVVGNDFSAWDEFRHGHIGEGIGELAINVGSLFVGVGELKAATSAARGARAAKIARETIIASRGTVPSTYLQATLPKAAAKVGKTPDELWAEATEIADNTAPLIAPRKLDPVIEQSERLRLEQAQIAAGKGSHFADRHGPQATLEQLYIRSETGYAPDGAKTAIANATRFHSYEVAGQAYDVVMQRWIELGKPPRFRFDITVQDAGDGFLRDSGEYVPTTDTVRAYFNKGQLTTMFPVIEPLDVAPVPLRSGGLGVAGLSGNMIDSTSDEENP